MSADEDAVFREGSTTYYWGAKFFPKKVRADVLKLYSFLRTADDYVDSVPAHPRHFHLLRSHWDHAKDDPGFEVTPLPDDTLDERVIKNIAGLAQTYAFDKAWVEAFWDSMQADLDNAQYKTLEQSLAYVYGSAEVVGLMMAKIMGLTPEAYESAKMQGRAMQWINFIRDIQEDLALGRCYFPAEDLLKCGLTELTEEAARVHPAAFKKLVHLQLGRYHEWQARALEGQQYIPRRQLPALRTAIDMYDWTAEQIKRDPFIVFERQIKPAKARVIVTGVRNIVKP